MFFSCFSCRQLFRSNALADSAGHINVIRMELLAGISDTSLGELKRHKYLECANCLVPPPPSQLQQCCKNSRACFYYIWGSPKKALNFWGHLPTPPPNSPSPLPFRICLFVCLFVLWTQLCYVVQHLLPQRKVHCLCANHWSCHIKKVSINCYNFLGAVSLKFIQIHFNKNVRPVCV